MAPAKKKKLMGRIILKATRVMKDRRKKRDKNPYRETEPDLNPGI